MHSGFKRLGLLFLSTVCLTTFSSLPPVFAQPPAPAPALNITFSPDSKASEADKREIEKLLQGLERDWNAHNHEAVMAYYSDEYLNNDGFDKKTVSLLTQDFWKEYPDVKSVSATKQIRVEGPYATVDSRDVTSGTAAREITGLGTKGDLSSVSEGQLYLKRFGNQWKIIGDRIDFEKVKVVYGLGSKLDPVFAAPEQIKAGKQFSAKVEVELPQGMTAMGSITHDVVQYPPPRPTDVWKFMTDPAHERPLLERVMTANTHNRNELLMATVGITNQSRNSLMGIVILTRRMNVVPHMEEEPAKEKEATTAEKPKESGKDSAIESDKDDEHESKGAGESEKEKDSGKDAGKDSGKSGKDGK